MLNLRRIRVLASAVTLMVLAAVLASPTAAAAAWTPGVSPLYSNEAAYRNLNGDGRSFYLNWCPAYYACIAVGEGDGQHTVFWLTECPTRNVSNFIDAGVVRNNQRPLNGTGVRVHLIDLVNGNLHKVISIPADNTNYGFDPYPIDQVDLC